MRILPVYVHPVQTSFAAALHAAALRTPRAAGHEVDDLDLTVPLAAETVQDLHDALTDYQLLFFRDQKLTHETQKALGAHFGRVHFSVGGDGTNSKQLSDHPEVRALHFDERSKAVSGNEMWHADQSCLETLPMDSLSPHA